MKRSELVRKIQDYLYNEGIRSEAYSLADGLVSLLENESIGAPANFIEPWEPEIEEDYTHYKELYNKGYIK